MLRRPYRTRDTERATLVLRPASRGRPLHETSSAFGAQLSASLVSTDLSVRNTSLKDTIQRHDVWCGWCWSNLKRHSRCCCAFLRVLQQWKSKACISWCVFRFVREGAVALFSCRRNDLPRHAACSCLAESLFARFQMSTWQQTWQSTSSCENKHVSTSSLEMTITAIEY